MEGRDHEETMMNNDGRHDRRAGGAFESELHFSAELGVVFWHLALDLFIFFLNLRCRTMSFCDVL